MFIMNNKCEIVNDSLLKVDSTLPTVWMNYLLGKSESVHGIPLKAQSGYSEIFSHGNLQEMADLCHSDILQSTNCEELCKWL